MDAAAILRIEPHEASRRACRPFRFGRRQIVKYDRRVSPATRFPLQPEDFPSVQPGDGSMHGRVTTPMWTSASNLRWHHRYSPFSPCLAGCRSCFGTKAQLP
jgi:hypothetical protein